MCAPAHRTSLVKLLRTPLSSFSNPDFIVLECFFHTVTKTLSFPRHLKWLFWTCFVQNWFQHQLIIISSTQCRTAGLFPPFKQMCFCCALNNSKASGWGARLSVYLWNNLINYWTNLVLFSVGWSTTNILFIVWLCGSMFTQHLSSKFAFNANNLHITQTGFLTATAQSEIQKFLWAKTLEL